MRSLIKWVIFLGILGGGGYFGVTALQAWWKERSKPRFLTAEITRGRVESNVNSTGTIKPVRSVSVGSFVSGPISEIHVDFNSAVKKGDLMARIDPRLFQAALERDKATLATQRADLARVDALLQQARNNEERARKLLAVNRDYLSEVELDQFHFTRLSLEAQRQVAEAAISQGEANLKNSQTNLDYTEIRAPVDGIVIERKVDPGQTMASAFQTPEMFIVAPDMDRQMHVYASVDEADIGQIRTAQERGQVVKFTVDAYPDDVFEGKIYQIRKSSTTVQNVVTYPVVIESGNPEMKLFPGMTANISFLIEAKDDVLRVPTAALRFSPLPAHVRPADRHYLETLTVDTGGKMSATEKAEAMKKRQRRLVWVVDGELLRAVPIVLGLSDSQYVEIKEGDLKDGDKVVTGLDTSIPVTPANRS